MQVLKMWYFKKRLITSKANPAIADWLPFDWKTKTG